MKRTLPIILVSVAILGIILHQGSLDRFLQRTYTELVALDVGQGDSILLRDPTGFDILIDGGPDNHVIERLGNVLPSWDRDIELMILTHPDSDHLFGLIEVLRRYRVREIWMSGVHGSSGIFDAWENERARERAIERTVVSGEQRVTPGGVTISVLAPLAGQVLSDKDPNAASVTVRVSYGESDAVLTGDLPVEGEALILSSGERIDAEILKAGHHGSHTSTSEEFLSAVNPTIAIFSVGADNRYGHPSSDVLERLEARGITIQRTDCSGTLRYRLYDDSVTMETQGGLCIKQDL